MRWSQIGKVRFPSSASIICPYCGEKGVFSLTNPTDDPPRLALSATAACPGCGKPVQFWSIRTKKAPPGDAENPIAVYFYPPIENHYRVPEFTTDIPEPLSRSFVSTIDAYNSRNYAATAVLCRRTLEGIFKYLLPHEKQDLPLHKAVSEVQNTKDLAAPLNALSHAIRQGGNLGAHFDMVKEPDEQLAKKMVALLEYLITYLYELPAEIEQIEKSLEKDA